MRKILLNNGEYALVDDEDFEFLNQLKWYVSAKGYAIRKPGKQTIFMHRLINKTPPELQTDHINKNKLDNRRKNLRSVTNQQNHFNMPLQKSNHSGVKGVYWDRSRKKWLSTIVINNKNVYLGRYKYKTAAVIARMKAERIYYVI